MGIGVSVIITYLIAMIAAGHGLGPIGLLLVFGDNAAWEGRIALGWFSVIIMFCLSMPQLKHVRHKGVQLLGIGMLYFSWLSFASAEAHPDWLTTHLLFSVPFQITVLVSTVITIRRMIAHNPDVNPSADE